MIKLCLIKHHAIKTHQSGGLGLCILNLSNRETQWLH